MRWGKHKKHPCALQKLHHIGEGAWHHAAFNKLSKKTGTPHPLCHTTSSSVSKPERGRSLLTKQTDHRGEQITYFSSTARDGCAPLQQNLWEHRSALYHNACFTLKNAGAASAVAFPGENRQINTKRGQNSKLEFASSILYEDGMEEEEEEIRGRKWGRSLKRFTKPWR